MTEKVESGSKIAGPKRRKPRAAGIVIVAVLALLMRGPAWAWAETAANEVVVFEDPNYQGMSMSLRLEPGMRHRLVPTLGKLDDKISSMAIGRDVKVMVCTDPHFSGAIRDYRFDVAKDMPDDDMISSLIVSRKGTPPQGVLVIHKRTTEVKSLSSSQLHYITGNGIFFPLPERLAATEARFPRLGADWNDKVRYVSVSPGVEVELCEDADFGGRCVSLPAASEPQKSFFDLSQYGFCDPHRSPPGITSSLKVRSREAGARK